MSYRLLLLNGRLFLAAKTQWAPTLTSHDPNPPMTLETVGLQPALAATLAGSTAITAAIDRLVGLASTGAGNLAVTAALAEIRDLTASAAGSEGVAGALGILRGLAATGGGATVMADAAMAILRGLQATVAGTTTATALMSLERGLEAAVAGSQAGIAGLDVQRTLAATVAGAETVLAALGVQRGLEASVGGGTTLAGSVAIDRALAAMEQGVSDFTAALTVTSAGGGPVDLAATIAGATQILADLTVQGQAVILPPPEQGRQAIQFYEDPGSYARLMDENKRKSTQLWADLFRDVLHLSEEDARQRARERLAEEAHEIEAEELAVIL